MGAEAGARSGVRALVEPGPELTAAQRARYVRHLHLSEIGEVGQRRLCNARVAVVGAGGLGSPVLAYLAAAGVGTLGVIDDDAVDVSNLQRQVLHGEHDLGRLKVESARQALAGINSDVEVIAHPARLTVSNAAQILGTYDLVIDGSDNYATRYLVNDTCVALGLPEVWGSIEKFYGQVAVFWGSPPPEQALDPVQLRDLFPRVPSADEELSCTAGGVLGALCGHVGSVMAVEAVKLVVGAGTTLLGKVMMIDDLHATQRVIALRSASSRADEETGLQTPAPEPHASAPDAHLHSSDRITAPALARALGASADTPILIDIRFASERVLDALPGAIDLSLDSIMDGSALASLPAGDVVVYCHSGVRSTVAALALERAGISARSLTGGAVAWHELVDSHAHG
ncbi:MAG: adenylyltransferase/sulfurtransferase MoeZ [Actinobacteria bacterium HGW-Actinobacteria-4]|nr:MAG: adenylyltransferase/sulfurtransferase MoeZ [Actinobacteria bacterium HGW-Actinobacteria-4]